MRRISEPDAMRALQPRDWDGEGKVDLLVGAPATAAFSGIETRARKPSRVWPACEPLVPAPQEGQSGLRATNCVTDFLPPIPPHFATFAWLIA